MKKTKIICIDAFKPCYLEHAPYLRSLTESNQYGELKCPIGFWGGMETFFKGSSNILAFFYYSENSSLKWVKNLTFLGRRVVEILINLKRLCKDEKQFFLTHNIPLKKIYMFETAVKRAFEQDAQEIDYLHIGELDKISHEYGTKAAETIECIKTIDKRLERGDFDVVFSDHGMMDVNEIVKVPETENCFIDSTMARYWGDKELELPLGKGKIIKWDKRYGDVIFLANPEVLILPNYWQGARAVKAMHGYSHPEMSGFYIIKNGKNIKRDLDMKGLHDEVEKLRLEK